MHNKRKYQGELGKITVIDRRNVENVRITTHDVVIVRRETDFIIFQDNWQFPVPASKRRFFTGKRELAVEELGKVPKKNKFRFLGAFIGMPTELHRIR